MTVPMQNDERSFSRLDQAFALFLSQRAPFEPSGRKEFEILLATLSQQQHQGHSCIEITEGDKRLLLASGFACEMPGGSPPPYPLVVEENRLYLQRYWSYEDRLAKQIKQLSLPSEPIDKLNQLLDRYFGAETLETDWQREAAKMACQQTLSIITGGPGTGKTTTVCKILAILQELASPPLLIALAAPTGKAAMRLQEAIVQNLTALDCPDPVKGHIPQSAITLHRLLGSRPPSPYFKHNAKNPLIFDLVVVDEASMVDLALMSKLVDALKPGARLILLGDKDQLASVESGAVLSDLIAALPSNTVELRQSHRFDSRIKKLAEAVNKQELETAWRLLSENTGTTGLVDSRELTAYILSQREEYKCLVNSKAVFEEIYEAFNRFQVLCSNRLGKDGALAISAEIEQALFGQFHYGKTNWYTGRPVMVLENNPGLHLYNGDIGICLPDRDQNGNLMVFFKRPDGSVKKILPARMPICETAFAMTIHKSQGSEFEKIVIVLPEAVNPVLSKELLYTAITRAKSRVDLVANPEVFAATINKKYLRLSGLSKKIEHGGINQ